MSEQVQEPGGEPEPDIPFEGADPETTDEPETPDEPETIEGEDVDEDEGQETDGQDGDPQSQALSEKALMKRDQQLDAEKTRHASRVGVIMGEAAVDLIPCPVCMDGIDGWIYTPEVAALSDEAVSRIRSVIGLPDYTTFKHVTWANTCEECGGMGKVLTGSNVPGSDITGCMRCNERGWINTRQRETILAPGEETPAAVTGPTVYTEAEPDERIAALRGEGYTIIPPMTVAV